MSAQAIQSLPTKHGVPALLPIKRSRKANIPTATMRYLPSATASKKRKSAIRDVSPVNTVPVSRSRSRRKGANVELSSTGEMPSPAIVSEDQEGQPGVAAQNGRADLILHIRETHRRRQDFLRAEKSLTNQIKAIGRRLQKAGGHGLHVTHQAGAAVPSTLNGGGDHLRLATQLPDVSAPPPISAEEGHTADDTHRARADLGCPENEQQDEVQRARDAQVAGDNVLLFATLPLIEARAVIKKHRLSVERECVKLAKQLPVWLWVEAINGFGPLGLAQITGEAGDLANYSNPAKLWKRMGLAVFDGKAQRRVAGAAAIEQGYSPQRRSIMFVIGGWLVKKQNPYRDLYLARKVTEQAKVPDGTKMLWHRRAQRYAEKRLLRDLWRAWRNEQPATN